LNKCVALSRKFKETSGYIKCGKVSTGLETISFSKRALLTGVSQLVGWLVGWLVS